MACGAPCTAEADLCRKCDLEVRRDIKALGLGPLIYKYGERVEPASERRVGARGRAKRRWDRENAWRYKDECPRCGGPKWIHARHCRACRRSSSPI